MRFKPVDLPELVRALGALVVRIAWATLLVATAFSSPAPRTLAMHHLLRPNLELLAYAAN